MRKLGISVYPEHSTEEKDTAYMNLAGKYGFSRIFTCLLSVQKPREEIVREFTGFVEKAHSLGFEVAADTNPEVFRFLGARPADLRVFADMGLDIIRLDGNFGYYEDRIITRNPYGIKIEFNGSADSGVELLISHGADPRNILICHNFYPEKYSGLSLKTFSGFNNKWKSLGLHTAAFVSSNNKDTFGPWPVYSGLPTLEADRGLPIDFQMRHLIAGEQTDDILIGNAYASEEELKAMSKVVLTHTTLKITPDEGILPEEKKAVFDYVHCGRTDASEYYVRSCIMRSDFKNRSIPHRAYDDPVFSRGDVVVVNDNLSHYRGEVEIVLQDIQNDGERNLVGRISGQEMMILDLIEEHVDHFFGFIE